MREQVFIVRFVLREATESVSADEITNTLRNCLDFFTDEEIQAKEVDFFQDLRG